MKKIISTLAILSMLGISASKADAPTLNLEKILEKTPILPQIEIFTKKEKNLLKEKFDYEIINKKIDKIIKERKYENDPIYSYIKEVYNSTEIPEYISEEFVRFLIKIESEDNHNAKSRKGARGLMQLTHQAWREVEKKLNFKKEVYNPKNNIYVGIKYLIWINEKLEKAHPRWNKLPEEEKRKIIAAAYNGGLKRLSDLNWNINKMPRETRNYVKKIENLIKY